MIAVMKYDPEWIFAVLEDLRAFANENGLPKTEEALSKAITVTRKECLQHSEINSAVDLGQRAH